MKILVLNGSPHKNGSSMTMAQAFCARLSGDVTVFHAYEGKVSPCIDCGACETRCPYNLPIREMLKKAAEQFGE